MSIVRILQYNVQKSKNGVMLPLIDGPHEPYDLIAIQEPWTNPFVQTTYCPRSSPYELIYPQEGQARTCFLLRKGFQCTSWKAALQPDYCQITFNFPYGQLTVHNIYSPIPDSYETVQWDTLLPAALQAITAPGDHLLLGDFNLHHTAWGGPSVVRSHLGAAELVLHLRTEQLSLLLEPGTVTREKQGNQPSTLDLVLCTPNLIDTICSCQAVEPYGNSDHLPIETVLCLPYLQEPTQPPVRRNFRQADTAAIEAGAAWLQPFDSLQPSITAVNEYSAYLTTFVQDLIEQTVPLVRKGTRFTPWWTQEVALAVRTERQARRQWQVTRQDTDWQLLQQAAQTKASVVVRAKQVHWRTTIHEASTSNEGIWKIAKWARTKSYLPPVYKQLPELQASNGSTAILPQAKADALAERFYPVSDANLTDIQDTSFTDESYEIPPLLVDRQVTVDDIAAILRTVYPDKCPGPDSIPNRFLKAMGQPLVRAIHSLIEVCLALEYFPTAFKHARTIVLRKPSKPDYSAPSAWRPIALLNTIGKVLEVVLDRKLRTTAEEYHLFPDCQMGNRTNRSTDTALALLVEQIRTVWESKKHIATVLSMDISGAFDTVNHTRLLDNLRKKGIPGWVVRTIRSFLTERTTSISVDGIDTDIRQLPAGVPQGSPLSPVLFLFYIAPLLDTFLQTGLPITVMGFADDTTLLAYGASTAANCAALERAYQLSKECTEAHGLHFAPAKFGLTHFTKSKQFDLTQAVRLDGTEIAPSPSIRILGLQLDSKLNWKIHEQAVHHKMRTQLLALSRTTASTWGATFAKARQLYLAVIRSSISYGAAIWHLPTPANRTKPVGLAAKLQKHQNTGLRTVLGAFKATPIRLLETEAFVPPLDLWLNGRLACFRARLARTSIGVQIENACTAIRTKLRLRQLRHRQQVQRPNYGTVRSQWAAEWAGEPIATWACRPEKKVLQDWKERWQAQNQRLGRSYEGNTEYWSGRFVQPDTLPNCRVLKLHQDLQKAESSLLVQIRTQRIGLAQFLYNQHVPGYETGRCLCTGGSETPRHITLFCSNIAASRTYLRNLIRTKLGSDRIDYQRLIGSSEGIKIFTRWFMELGCLGQFSLARQLLYHSND
jgi:hypothetical protein